MTQPTSVHCAALKGFTVQEMLFIVFTVAQMPKSECKSLICPFIRYKHLPLQANNTA